MRKSELKNGMVVKLRSGEFATVMLNIAQPCLGEENVVLFSSRNWTGLKSFSQDLLWYPDTVSPGTHSAARSNHQRSVDIVSVYLPDTPNHAINNTSSTNLTLIWERKELSEPEKMTLTEVCLELGRDIVVTAEKH